VVRICHFRQENNEAKEECNKNKKKSNGKKMIPITFTQSAKRMAHSVTSKTLE
jgi:hypothetical protein